MQPALSCRIVARYGPPSMPWTRRQRPHLCAAVGAILLLAAPPAAAQQHDEQLWLQTNVAVPLADRFRLTLEQISRFGDRPDGLYTTEFGGIVGYKLADTIEIGFGYRRVDFHNGNMARGEHRIRQHVVASFGAITTRLRIDERFHPAGKEIGFRVRPLVRYNHKLARDGVALFASHESFLIPNSTRWGQRAGYERMRSSIGATLPVGRRLSADVGYMNQYRLARGGARAQMDHGLSIQLTINLGDASMPKTDD
jgi:hypothetical protein